ncbi:pyridoxamine 5'-phosphate oxidase family protein [Thiobacillus sp.]|uniref:pyridoxamine 5'-phosphate oxidase family protein n=1 Tax=Thiobacillus sp. TaxID=924 RepID=UPI0025E302E5|nr:pyridoxamine 5'-phosphate oxidase family protein [Thiobacillus sp.]MBT9539562.1 pyridoxamine 5'-phosphate oxidase family protein [Thiobacillus sp.]
MARFYPELEARHCDFIAAQKMFFTASGTASSRLNLSPKGMDSLRVLSPSRVAYLDLTGSGNETAAHLKHDGRMTLMWCSFDADPLILRLYGRGRAVRRQDATWGELRAHFPALPGERQLIVLDIESVQTSCGYAVPRYTYAGERDTLARWAEKKGTIGLLEYWREKNQLSIDGLTTGLLENT